MILRIRHGMADIKALKEIIFVSLNIKENILWKVYCDHK
jgi:hypothetical protein